MRKPESAQVLINDTAADTSLSCYSAYEHATYVSAITSRNRSPPSSIRPAVPSSSALEVLPLDVSIETVVSVVLICVGLVMGAEQLKPINWRVWAGRAEVRSGGGGPFQGLESRVGFMDIRVRLHHSLRNVESMWTNPIVLI